MGAGGSSCAPCKCDLPINALRSLITGTETLHRANEELLVWIGSNRYRFEGVENSTNNVGKVEDLIKCLESQWEAWSMLARMVRIPIHQTFLFADGREVMTIPSRNATTAENLLAWMYKLSHEQRIFAREMLKVQSRLQSIIKDLKPSFTTDAPAVQKSADMKRIDWNAGSGIYLCPEYDQQIRNTEKEIDNLRGRQEQEELELEALREREAIEEQKLDLIRQCQSAQKLRLEQIRQRPDTPKMIPLVWPCKHNQNKCGCNKKDKLAADELKCTIYKQDGDALPAKHLSLQLGPSNEQDFGACSCQHARAVPTDVKTGDHASNWTMDWQSKDVVTARPPHFPCCDNYPVPALREQ